MFLDTSIIVEILRTESGDDLADRILGLVKEEPLYISILQVAELADWCNSNGVDAESRLSRLKEIASMVPLTEYICLLAAAVKRRMRGIGISKFGLADGIILASARSMGQKVLTMDTDFSKAPDAIIL